MAKYHESEDITCPVCGKPVGLDVAACPHCGAEFEDEGAEIAKPKPAAVAASDIEEDVACPVCGKAVGLDVAACPHCGAEFEEEEIEEVIEVEERQVEVKEEPARVKKARPAVVAEEEEVESEGPTSILDLKVIGLSLILLGILGSQISLFIDWYWSWVPPIEDNLGMFVAVAVIVVVVGLLVWMLVKKLSSEGKSVPNMVPSTSLSLFLFGVFALILVLLWNPINSALQDNKVTVAVAFIAVLIAGLALIFLDMRSSEKAACD